eukprot:CAMPEP_0205889432 /NCGR_PEP_ID=MMETSP1083-20121108/20956_1 /ASSEMBLY_ACC=CAM_ASM_000430 /TAXON_ID=97485 /ORGANISM="Prymnesium parvum, Strain Texoma1" /LENGTH=153 /DNA_ID=CAMNT_0053253515 /DNA_START=617 /DNA_END=1079 /DNA_ORIENTATION=+
MRRAISVMNPPAPPASVRVEAPRHQRDELLQLHLPVAARVHLANQLLRVLMGDDHSHRFHDLHELARLDVAVAVFVELGEGLVDLFQLVAREKLRPWVLLDDFKIGRGERMQFDQRVIGHALLRRSDSRPPAGRAARPHEPLSDPSPRGGWDL